MKYTHLFFTVLLFSLAAIACDAGPGGTGDGQDQDSLEQSADTFAFEGDETFSSYDRDADQLLGQEEFALAYDTDSYFELWDLNEDGLISDEEWKRGWEQYYDHVETYSTHYEQLDRNRDQTLDSNEFHMATYVVWDVDGDGTIDRAEYDIWDEHGWKDNKMQNGH